MIQSTPSGAAQPAQRPRLSLLRILEMNLGFLGLQFSFGLQQGNMVPIYSWLGADPAHIPLLQLAGPVTGLLVQPLIGALSDRTLSRFGRRTPYFLIGAITCSLCLLAMPFSTSVLMAASLLWLLDAGNNISMEPYRAYVADRLSEDQHASGFLMQSALTNLGHGFAHLSPSIMVYLLGVDSHAIDAHHIPAVTHLAFVIGAVLSLTTILWSVLRVPELPLSPQEQAGIAAASHSPRATLAEIAEAMRAMPKPMRQMLGMSLFQWYALWIYWSYAALSIARSAYETADKTGQPFREAVLTQQQMGALYAFIGVGAALAMMPLGRRWGRARLHAACLTLAGLSLLWLPLVGPAQADPASLTARWFSALAMPGLGLHPGLMLTALGMGLGWSSIMGNPYAIIARAIPPQRNGVYMGIFNMMVVTPMILNSLTFGWIYNHLLGSDPRRAITLAGALMLCAALSMIPLCRAEATTRH
ncbi:MFS transporter [Novosphingobium rosa]|uniref:MFS transporter n=1 Tax=Novosphingobium rosa TaxID=76978 RepID=UPI000A70C18F|nr:MFS transporter [Novosphingobium rosa]